MSNLEELQNILVNPHKPIESWKGAIPTRAFIFKIKLSADDNDFDIQCVKVGRFTIDASNTLPLLLQSLAAGNAALRNPNMYRPFKSSMSMNVSELAYIIFVLKNRKLQFSNQFAPFSIGADYPSQLFGDATKIDQQGRPAALTDNECKIGYFVMDGHGALQSFPSDLGRGYSFNLHVDVITKGENSGGQSIPSYLPLTIDPDIRHPGGSGP